MFRTELNSHPSIDKIKYSDPIITLGSCFAENIGSRLEINKFNVLHNPFGVIFNPLSQFKLLEYAIKDKYPVDYTYVENQGVWYNYDFHSDFSAMSRDELKLKVEGAINQVAHTLNSTNWLFLTFGTAFGYYLNVNNKLVANCHKIPASEFSSKLISQKEILHSFKQLHSSLRTYNPGIKIIITVSPVRHLKDTLELNSVSKSILRISCHSMQRDFDNVQYFPAYEILLDDLRDYRFYDKDMLHPNETGQEYIWEKFLAAFLDDETKGTMEEWEKVRRSLEHRPFHSETEAHKKFLETTAKQLSRLENRIDVSKEMEHLKKQLSK